MIDTTDTTNTTDTTDTINTTDTTEPIEVLAYRWLSAERTASARNNVDGTEERARTASAAYDDAVNAATREELLLAWHAARRLQDSTEMGSAAWAEARAVSELLRLEYLAGA